MLYSFFGEKDPSSPNLSSDCSQYPKPKRGLTSTHPFGGSGHAHLLAGRKIIPHPPSRIQSQVLPYLRCSLGLLCFGPVFHIYILDSRIAIFAFAFHRSTRNSFNFCHGRDEAPSGLRTMALCKSGLSSFTATRFSGDTRSHNLAAGCVLRLSRAFASPYLGCHVPSELR